jgi:flagellar protein FlaJ
MKSQEQIALEMYEKRKKKHVTKQSNTLLIIVGISLAIAILLFIVGVLSLIKAIITEPIYWLDFFIFGLLILIGPYGFYASAQYSKIKDIEKRLPEFLRDVAEAGRFGMILADAVVVASSGRYGRLTPEIKKMAAQIKWGIPVTESLRLFAERVNTPMVNKTVAIIVKSNEAGGNVADVLALVSHNAKETLLSDEERGIAMSTYVAVVYIAFFVFLVVILVLTSKGSFLEKMEEAGKAVSKGLEGAEGAGGITLQTTYIPQVSFALVVAALAHAIGDGVLAGVLQNGKIASGMRHSFILTLMGYLVLRFLMRKDYLLGGIGV